MRAKVIRLDPIACDGHGICAELLPERIVLDDWGYPIIDPEPVSGELLVHANRAVTHCPALALRLERAEAAIDDRRADRTGHRGAA
ncbi:MAG: ferredoxin [Actinomycetota bacterium]|nr:ferredoxin [Actinomycetota bacterium]